MVAGIFAGGKRIRFVIKLSPYRGEQSRGHVVMTLLSNSYITSVSYDGSLQ